MKLHCRLQARIYSTEQRKQNHIENRSRSSLFARTSDRESPQSATGNSRAENQASVDEMMKTLRWSRLGCNEDHDLSAAAKGTKSLSGA
jgi:hypothetical protein